MKNRTQGFTLIELLVVVAIIVVLISVLMPSLNNARNQAKAVKCGSNLKQIGQAMHMYAQENNGTLPVWCWSWGTTWPSSTRPVSPDPRADWTQNLWMVRLYPYLNVTVGAPTFENVINAMYGGVFRCPSKNDFSVSGGDGFKISYAMNAFSYDEYGNLRKDENGNVGGGFNIWYQKLNFLEPSVLLVADAHLAGFNHTSAIPALRNNDYLYNIGFLPQYHSFGHNILFSGGDVQRVPVQGMYYTLRKLSK